MWLERFLIIVPSLGHKYLPYSWGTYRPRPVEIMITVATFAAMTLLYVLFAKFVPIISIWELKAGKHPSPALFPAGDARASTRRDARMKALYALYADGHAAQKAVDGLRAAGVADNDITVISAAADGRLRVQPHGPEKLYVVHSPARVGSRASPSPPGWHVSPKHRGRSRLAACPSSSWWPNLIIMFELTMLGAILATVITLIVTARLGRRRPALYDSEVTDGKILVGIENPHAASLPALQKALRITASTELKTL